MIADLIENTDWSAVAADQISRWLMVFALDLTRYLVAVGLVTGMLFVLFRKFSEARRIQNKRASFDDVRRELKYSILTVAVYASVALFTIEAVERGWMRLYEQVSDYGLIYLWLSIPLLLVLHDAYFYWVHRSMHHPRLFRRVHRIHHLSRTPTSWAAYSFSAWEAMMMALFVPLAMSLLPIHPLALFVFLAIMIVRNAMGHSGIEFHPVGWVDSPFDLFTSITHHDLHHQQLNGNYGLYFTWWDRWMGTELPGYKEAFRKAATPHSDQLPLTVSSLDAEVL